MFRRIAIVFFAISFNVQASDVMYDVQIFESGNDVKSSKVALTEFLSSMTLGNDGFYNKALSPAKSLNLNLSGADRIQEVNIKIIDEMNVVLSTFKDTPENKKLEAVQKIVNGIDPDIFKNGGANIQFINGSPSAAFSRTLIMIEKKAGNVTANAEKLMNTLSSYKRSAIQGTYVYEYSDSRNISQSTIKISVGSDATWKTPLAADGISANQDLVLKKCRQIFGWKCVTAIYKTGGLLTGADSMKYLYAGIYDLVNNADHSDFINDKRSFNQITGSTALYVIKESTNWILLYGVDSQWNTGSISFEGLIKDEFLKDAKRIRERISLDFKISPQDIR